MPILATERWSDRSLSYSWKFNAWRASRGFDVAYAGDDATAIAAVGQFGVYKGSSFDLNPLLKCVNVSAKRIGLSVWHVHADYIVPFGGTIPTQLDPLKTPPRIRWYPGTRNIPSDTAYDPDGNIVPMINTARAPFEPQDVDRTVMFLQVRKYIPYYDPAVAAKIMNAVNKDAFTVRGQSGKLQIQPGQGRCNNFAPTDEYSIDATFVEVVYDLEFRPDIAISGDGWDLRLPNRGWYGWFKAGSVNTPGMFYRGTDPITEPAYLNAAGVPLDPTVKVGPALATPVGAPNSPQTYARYETLSSGVVVLHYAPYRSIAFAGLF